MMASLLLLLIQNLFLVSSLFEYSYYLFCCLMSFLFHQFPFFFLSICILITNKDIDGGSGGTKLIIWNKKDSDNLNQKWIYFPDEFLVNQVLSIISLLSYSSLYFSLSLCFIMTNFFTPSLSFKLTLTYSVTYYCCIGERSGSRRRSTECSGNNSKQERYRSPKILFFKLRKSKKDFQIICHT